MAKVSLMANWIVLKIIWFYRYAISPHFPPSCRFEPTCSAYAHEAVEKFGVCRGLFYAFKRLIRCHPFNSGGYDPLP